MKRINFYVTTFILALLFGCMGAVEKAHHQQVITSEAEILQSWQGDYPIVQLKLLPEEQREQPVGYIDDANIFGKVWKAFKPGEEVPEINFKSNLVLYARNTQFYNHIRIGKVNVKKGIAEVISMETLSALPIEDRVAISLVEVHGKGITAIQSGDEVISVNKKY